MTEIQKLIQEIQDNNILVSSLLRKTKILASELDQKDFLDWVNLELNGYKDDSAYPDYRKLSGEIKGWNPYRGWIPVLFESSEVEGALASRQTKQSIPEIEELLSSKSGSFEMPYPASVANQILNDSSIKTKVSLFIDRTALVGILNSVRNSLLEWVLKLEKQGIKGENTEFTKEEKEKAQNIKSNYRIENIENFHGNIGENNRNGGEMLTPKESFFNKVVWYILVALAVVIVGNILSAIILKYFFRIS